MWAFKIERPCPINQLEAKCMINEGYDSAEFEIMVDSSAQSSVLRIDQEFNHFIEASPLRREIFNAIERLETRKISLMDKEFKAILNRWRV